MAMLRPLSRDDGSLVPDFVFAPLGDALMLFSSNEEQRLIFPACRTRRRIVSSS
jgi:hypothetical protein